ncbi:MAG: hypothetical protein AABX47_09025 [Nanoarchaeota archaeon]
MSEVESGYSNDVLESMLVNNYFNKIVGIDSLAIRMGPRNPPHTQEQYQVIQQKWDDVQNKNPKAFSKIFLAINGFQMDQHTGALTLDAYLSSYMDWSGTKTLPAAADRIWCLGTCGLAYVMEGDKKLFVFGKRTSATLNVGGSYESLPGGFTEPAIAGDTKNPVITSLYTKNPVIISLYRELEEEVGVKKDQVISVKPFSFGMLREWRGALFQDTCVNSLIHISLDEAGINAAFEANNENKRSNGKTIEHTQMTLVPESEIGQFIEQYRASMGVRTLFTLESYVQMNHIFGK